MYSLDLPLVSSFAAIAGVLSHVTWFIRGDHDFQSRNYASLWMILHIISFYALTRVYHYSIVEACAVLTLLSLSYLGSLFTSIAIYRTFFHKLRNFPGRLTWKLSKLSHVAANADSMGYKHLDDLHKRFGDFVRIGPNELSITDPAAPEAVLGVESGCSKAIWYDFSQPIPSMHQCCDKKLHDMRRRIWEKAFSMKSLRNYEGRVYHLTDVLTRQIKGFNGQSFDAAKWFNYYFLDVMGSLAFGTTFGMMETGEKHYAISLLEAAMAPMNMIPVAPWLFYLVSPLLTFTSGYYEFYEWSSEVTKQRKEMKMEEVDIMHHFLEARPMSNDAVTNKNWETGDSRLAILAGSDTLTSTMTYCLLHLIKKPEYIRILRDELDDLIRDDPFNYKALQGCQYLKAVIDETLRLHPAIPSGLIRVTPPEGLMIGETFVPGGINITLPAYTTHRSAKAFEYPDEFIPERWLDKPELVKNKAAFHAFSKGSFNCVGRGLAYMELRIALSQLIVNFDVDFDVGENGSRLIEQSEDHFSMRLAPMSIVCKQRGS